MSGETTFQADGSEILRAIQDLRLEVKDDMDKLSEKIDRIMECHNGLEVEVAKSNARHDEKIAVVERNVSSIWDAISKQRDDTVKIEGVITTHVANHEGTGKAARVVSEWVRWIPGIVISIIVLIASFFRGGK